MKAKLLKQPRVSIMIPLESKENFGATESVILNGYRLNIKKGVYVEVPKQVAEIVMDAQRQTRIAENELLKRQDGSPMRIDGNNIPEALQR